MSKLRVIHRWHPNCICACLGFAKKLDYFDMFAKFRQCEILELHQMFLHEHSPTRHTCAAPKFLEQTLKIKCASSKSVFCIKFRAKKCNILCLCSKVWQQWNVKVASNGVEQSLQAWAYLYCPVIWCANSENCMRNAQSPNVAKTNPNRPKWKRIFPGF